MKIKQIINYLLVALLVIQLASCDNKETLESPFNGTPTERLNAKEKELNDLLMGLLHSFCLIVSNVRHTDSTSRVPRARVLWRR